jgi:hypothetical protein
MDLPPTLPSTGYRHLVRDHPPDLPSPSLIAQQLSSSAPASSVEASTHMSLALEFLCSPINALHADLIILQSLPHEILIHSTDYTQQAQVTH